MTVFSFFLERSFIYDNIFIGLRRKTMAKEDRYSLTLKCTVCGEENYLTEKNKKNNPERLEVLKYCPVCKKKTLHREKKK